MEHVIRMNARTPAIVLEVSGSAAAAGGGLYPALLQAAEQDGGGLLAPAGRPITRQRPRT